MKTDVRIRSIIANTDPQVTKKLQNLLNLIEGVEVVNCLRSAEDTLTVVRETSPRLALIDINLADVQGIKLTEMIRRDHPSTQVIVTCQHNFTNLVLQAMRIGALDFVTHDVSLEELSLAVKRVDEIVENEKKRIIPTQWLTEEVEEALPIQLKSNGRKGKIITVYSTKGGAGVTTLAINLAIALQDSESTVALVDGSLQFGDVGILLNELGKNTILDLVSRIYELDDQVIQDVMVLHKASGIYLMTAPPRPEMAEKVTGKHVSQILDHMKGMFDYIIINTSAYITDACLASLEASDCIVLMITQEIASIKGTRSFLELWGELGEQKDNILLVLNRFKDQRTLSTDKIGESLKRRITATIPNDEETVIRSANLGVPFMMEKKNLPIAKSVTALAELIRKEMAETEGAGR